MTNLNIKIESLVLSNDIIQPNDIIRICVTTLPDDQTQAYNVGFQKIEEDHHQFSFEVSKLTKKLIVIIRKKSHSKKDPIIASTIIHSDKFLKSSDDKSNINTQNILLYEPFPKDLHNQNSILENRKILGNIDLRFSI